MNKTALIVFAVLMSLPAASCKKSIKAMLEPGVSTELARYRARQVSDVSYELFFHIPRERDLPVEGQARIRFSQARAQYGVVLDFQGPGKNIRQVMVNGREADWQFLNGHIIIPSSYVVPYGNEVDILFLSADQALNRSDDFMYTLFVPDRASTAFPCFDQPDLKARFTLSLSIPEGWTAVSNGPAASVLATGNRKTVSFAADQPIPTYLFAFAAGQFDTFTEEHGGREMTLYHRETDTLKLARNLPHIFRQHALALEWLEEYTGIPYPFGKMDMVLLPGFQYSGMEHPGCIWYRDARLLLDEHPPISQQLSRASLIAHETAHMWFGNLVTMRWFDDVWLKEVFAGFMADKIVNPQFPEVNHDLQFLLSHYPRAAAIDRSRGTHPIRQPLSNMKQAGTLYGAIIYNKAPLVFRELEMAMGGQAFRAAVRDYLREFSMDNADWDELAAVFDRHTPLDVKQWSDLWIYGTGMPDITTAGMNEESLRGMHHLMLHEEFLQGKHRPMDYFQVLLSALFGEPNPQLARYLADNLRLVYWRFLDDSGRRQYGPAMERLLWDRLVESKPSEKAVYLEAYLSTAQSETALHNMLGLLEGNIVVEDLDLSESQRFSLVAALKLREHPEASRLLEAHLEMTDNPDRRRRLEFLLPALSDEPGDRDRFFENLRDPVNRRPEPWVLEGLSYLHHPLRREAGRRYILPALEMLEEIQSTGDIFFPLNWLESSLGAYSDPATASLVEEFLDKHPGLNDNLRLKVLQAADLLFRSAALADGRHD
jgi:aminopeptidase N